MAESYIYKQYKNDKNFLISHNYLSNQFKDYRVIFSKIEKIVKFNDFTLGKEVEIFEKKISKLLNSKYVISVGSGTDALMLSLKALGVREGDEVITSPYTFYATIGAIVTAGAKPVFADIKDDYNIDPGQIEKKITKKTRAILPIHWSGKICDMDKILKISKSYKIPVVEDSCHGILATRKKKFAGTFGDFGCFSLHPLKNLNVWGDGGFIIVKNKINFEKIKLLRNHGLVGRNKNLLFGYNSRLDTVQACVANHLLKKIKFITKKRIENAEYLDKKLKINNNLILKKKENFNKDVYHLYEIRVKNFKLRNKLVKFLQKNKIDAKIHYPVPMHMQPAAKVYGYSKGDFKVTEIIAGSTISLPVHEFVSKKELNFMIKKINKFFDEN